MNMHIVPPTPPVAIEPKYRIITLTNRAPVRIIEEEWETIAEGKYCEEARSGPEDFVLVKIRVRRHKPKTPTIDGRPCPSLIHHKGYIIHGKYELYVEDRMDTWQRVRVGRLVDRYQAAMDLWKHIDATGDELRARIKSDHCRKHVIHAVDDCFANLAALDV